MKKIFESCIWFILAIGACIYFSNLWIALVFLFFHELAHYATGKILGYSFKSVSLLPFGMRFGFKEEFIYPRDDIIISLAGPIINFLFFILFLSLNNYNSSFELFKNINIVLCVFNLIPAAFLDGGRIFKAIAVSNFGFNKGHIITNINGIILGIILFFFTFQNGLMYKKIPLLLMGAFFIYKSIINIREITINIINETLLKQNYMKNKRNWIIELTSYSEKTKILDIIKNFCFNKYYIIYIMDNGHLRYNINETDLIKIYCNYGNINLGKCADYINVREGYYGKFK